MFTVSLDLVRPSPNPIRKTWDEDKMQELAASIKERGVIVPIKVRPVSEAFHECRYHGVNWIEGVQLTEHDEACFFCNELRGIHGIYEDWQIEDYDPAPVRGEPFLEIVYGHRRVEAARRAGLTEIPAIVENEDDTGALIEALIENVQREDMNPLDEAKALKALVDSTGWSYREIERRGIMPNDQVVRRIGLLDESPEVQALIAPARPGPVVLDDPALGIRHIQEVRGAGLEREDRTRVLLKVADESLTRHEARAVADAYKAAPTPELKEAVLQTSGKLGDSDRILEVARMKVGVQSMTERNEAERRQVYEEYDQAAKDFFDFTAHATKFAKATQNTVRYGKFSPEAARFAIRRIDTLMEELTALKEALGKVNNE